MADREEQNGTPEEEGKASPQPNTESETRQDATDGDSAARSALEEAQNNAQEGSEENVPLPPQKKKSKKWITNLLLLLLIGVGIGMMFLITGELGGDSVGVGEMVRGINPLWFGLFVGLMLLLMFFGALKYAYLLKISTGKFHLGISIKAMFLGKYYDGITPLGTGGQPFQIYYLHKKKISSGAASSVPLVRYVVEMIVFCLSAVGLLIAAHFVISLEGATRTVTFIVAWISLACNFVIPLIVVFASIAPKLGKKLVVWLVNLLGKMRIVKHKYPVMKKYIYEMGEYTNSMRLLFAKWWKLLPLVFINLVDTLAYVCVPYFAVLALSNVPPTADLFLQMCCMSMISFFATSLIPTPGNSGANESATTLIIVQIAIAFGFRSLSGWVVLFWRFAIYYVYILIGICINTFDLIHGAVKNRRAKKKE